MGGYGGSSGARPRGKSVVSNFYARMTREQRMCYAFVRAACFGFLLFYLLFSLAAGLSRTLTGRCIRCVATGNYHCGWLAQNEHPGGK